MSEMIQCDKCKKLAYKDSRSEKDAMCRMQIDYVDGLSVLYLCKSCYRQFRTEFVWDYTPKEFDDTFGRIE